MHFIPTVGTETGKPLMGTLSVRRRTKTSSTMVSKWLKNVQIKTQLSEA